MKSRTSCFNKTIFLKNLTRFAPAWGLYTVGALMGLVLLLDSSSKHMASNLIDAVQILSLITPCYALLCALLLFGDLYSARTCNALHALPLRRETWFFTNVISGFVFHLIPTLVLTVLAVPILAVYCPENSVLAAPIFLLGTNLQFACFFGLAVLSALCVGSRFAQGVVYSILNFGSVLLGWLLETLYIPQFYGVELDYAPFFYFSPIAQMMETSFVHTERLYTEEFVSVAAFEFTPGGNFVYYFIVAAVGIGLLFLALQLYRRRKLECAGDFLAIRGLEPIFQVIYSLVAGAAFYFLAEDVVGMDTPVFLFVGLLVGWFTGKMLLERTPRVFRLRNILHSGVLMAAVGLSLVVAALDPFGIVSWIPQGTQVESVGISTGWYSPRFTYDEIVLTDPEDILQVIKMHREAVEFYEEHGSSQFRVETAETIALRETMTKEQLENWDRMNFNMSLTLNYHMHSGRTVSRYYSIWMGDETGQYLREIFSRPEAIFGSGMTEERFLEANSLLVLRDTWHGEEIYIHQPEDIRGLYRAIIADCKQGTMAQQWDFHHPDESLFCISYAGGEAITVFSNAENTLRWLRAYGVDTGAIEELYGK